MLALVGTVVAVIAVIVVFVAMSYTKAPPDVAYLISGLRKQPKIVIGKATLRIPFLERIDKIPLKLIQVDIETQNSVPTSEFINIFVDGVANIKISNKPELLAKASENFLNRDTREIGEVAQQVLEGNMREIIGQMKLTDLVNQRDEFGKKVQENATSDMSAMGLEIVNLTIQNFTDENNVINDLGIDNITKIQKDAQIAKAQSQRDVKIAQAKADEEGAKARAEADAQIAEQEKILAIKKSEYKKEQDIKKAEADAAYEIQQQEQLQTINEKTVQAEVIKTEKEAELREKQVILKEKELDATIRKEADAELYRKQKEADALNYVETSKAKAENDAAYYKIEAIKKEADAKKYAMEQEAEGKKAILLAEAEGIKAKGLAEAEGISAKAEAQKLMGEASVLEMYLNVLPQIAENVAKPLGNVKTMTLYGSDNTTQIVKEVTNNLDQINSAMSKTTGIDLKDILGKFVGKKEQQRMLEKVVESQTKQPAKDKGDK